MKDLTNKRVAIVATDGFEQSELLEPKKALEAAGARVDVISLKPGRIRGWKMKDWGDEVEVDAVVGSVRADDYDALVLPGGVINPAKDGPTGGWGTAARWFLFALLLLVLILAYRWMTGGR